MKQILLLFLLLSSIKLSGQQIIIKGEVIDSADKKPLGYTTVVLSNAINNQPVKSALAKDDGTFEFTVAANKPYNLNLAFIGYAAKMIKVPGATAGAPGVVDLGKISLMALQGQLKEVAVTAFKPILKQEIDRISYDVQADPENKANDALEMLRKVPMITVDGYDVIQLKGSTSYRIFINGKPSALMAANPSEVLKSMPAATIKKIEVITVPPAKYEAEGLAGIINIITVQKNNDGINGSIFGRYNNIVGERGSVSLNVKKDKFGLNTLFGLGYQKSTVTNGGSELATYSPATDLFQQGQNLNSANLNNGQIQFSYEADSLNLLNATLDFNNHRLVQNTYRNSRFLILPDSLSQAYQLSNIGRDKVGAFDFGLNYQAGFKHDKNELLTLLYQYSGTSNNQDNAISAADRFNYTNDDYDQQNSSGSKEHTFQLDFVKPVHKLVIEAGAKTIFRNNYSNFESENIDQATGQLIPDTLQTNQFKYRQNVYSIYNSYQLKVKQWILKGGLRAEKTDITGSLSASGTTLNQNYLNVIPSLAIQRNYPQTGSFTLGYTERIERPGIKQLNPFVDRSNPGFIVTGNPDLKPVLSNIFELSYSKFGKTSLNASLNYAFSNNTVQTVTSLISDTLSKTTYLNVGKNKSAGINIGANYPVSTKMNISINGQLSHLWITGVYDAQFYKNDGNQGNINAFARYNYNSDLNFGVNVGYLSGNVFLQGKSSDYVFTAVNIIKDFLNKNATVSLTINDPFKKFNTYSSYTKTPDFEQSTYSQSYYQNFRLAINYKFGRLNNSVKVNHTKIKNDDVKVEPVEN